ncbi:hypothetical protein E3T46_07865 [Cryobacterium sp. Hh11]|uniref:phage antirepressor KilAC domain-containing protein n=1 Tax=Cryobacterium sp. Hh11 TaxID=2555868 RepID=UPI00106A01CD|nr:phage antirepressor KilAC domain-containing protein [Cryobacterium sp. Hh11]TFD51996.1 hypothetical protein E3T46_07865 [Cryobacterium sp. Hh11]
MTALDIFTYSGQQVRTVTIDSEPWFVATDVAAILDLGNVHSSLALLDDDERGLHSVETASSTQAAAVVSESGLYSLILRSRKAEAKAFKRWLTHEVLPAIRKTGMYSTAPAELSRLEILTMAIDSERRAVTAETAVAALTPSAAAWDELASASGDYEVADAAKILARAGIETGRQRLFTQIADLGWILRGSHGSWKAYQSAVDSGYLAEKPVKHFHPKSGEVVLDPPQVRVTVKGLERLRVRLGALILTP